MRRHLSTLGKSKRINMVTSNSIYQDVLLNWLISAAVRSQLPLQSILVISLSQSLHTKLVERKIPSVYIPYFSLLRRGINFTQDFEKVMMLRLAVMRLLNHWGFDVHNYDTDAVLLKDPQPLYDRFAESDIIGSVGKIPRNLMAFWGITVCIGVVILKSNPHTEVYWQRVSTICLSSHDDQEKLNCGLKALRITWDKAHSNHNTTVVEGKCSSGLTVSILPYDYICRLDTCDPTRRSDYYIWHKGGTRSRREKLKGSREGQTWFLRYKWNKIKNRLTGIRWLESIAYWEVTHS